MKDITIKAKAKINLFLEVTGKLDNGYHTISTVMHEIDLWDDVTVSENTSKQITLTSDNTNMPLDSSNIAYRAAEAFYKNTGIEFNGINIDIKKNIPMEAGLAGGSADGAAVLKALNEISQNTLTTDELCEIGAKIGADVPFCIKGGACLCTGIGDIMTPCNTLPKCTVLIAKGAEGMSTPRAYNQLDTMTDRKIHDNNMPELLECGDIKAICNGMYNCFELLIPSIETIKTTMKNNGALGAMMSGSGTSVFGIFDDMTLAAKAEKKLIEKGLSAFICGTM